MLGHPLPCGCPLCLCLARVSDIIRVGGAWPEFIGFACSRLRGVEADLRDELSRVAAAVPGDRPPPPGAATEGSRPSHSQTPKKEATASASAPGPLQAAQPPPPPAPGGLTNKAPPLQPPAHLQEKPESKVEKKVKEEPADEDKPNQEQGVVEVELQETNASGSGSKPENPPKEETKQEKKRKASSSRRREEKKEKREKEAKRRRESRSPRRREEDRERGREKKRRDERPPEPRFPPRGREEHYHWGPREPDHPPPRGSGWRGPLPYSDHPRWSTGKNKGNTRRAKQELFNNRERRRR